MNKKIEKEEFKNLKILTKRKEKQHKKIVDKNWIIKITLLAFILSFLFSFISEVTLPNVNLIWELILVIFFIALGVLFDMIGVAVTSADSKPFHSMSSRKVKGAKTAVKLIQNADKVSSFCNDVIGDICGIISGSAGSIISVTLASTFSINIFITTLITTAVIASLTIGGKALGKSYAINKNNLILYQFAKFLSYFKGE
jgi:CBS domain containing-hemolysin-like protein